MVFDRYLPNSIKRVTRTKRKRGKSKGIRRDVESREQRIGNWDRFIVVEENKASLAHFLSTEMSQRYGTHPGRELVVSGGFREILNVWSSDASRESLQELSSDHEEADTRIVLHAAYIPVHKISLPEEKRKSLLAFHTITGCDTTSQFAGIGKQSALKIFDSSSELIEHLGEHCPPHSDLLLNSFN